MAQNIENDLAVLTGLRGEELERVANYVRARAGEEKAPPQKQKSRRVETQQLSGKDFLQQMRQTLRDMFDADEEPEEIIKAAVGFAISNYHNGVAVARGEGKATRQRSRWRFNRKRY